MSGTTGTQRKRDSDGKDPGGGEEVGVGGGTGKGPSHPVSRRSRS